MRKKTKHYPFPEKRKDIVLDEIIYPHGREKTDAEEMYWHKKLFSKEVRMLQAQYLILERELMETFEYVYPCDDHLDVYSAKYAQIIKGACNLFELIAHQIYNEIYVCDRIDILNFLTLDRFLDLKKVTWSALVCREISRMKIKYSSHSMNSFGIGKVAFKKFLFGGVHIMK